MPTSRIHLLRPMSDHLLYGVADGVAEIELHRRDKKNALNASMYGELADALSRAQADDSVRVLLMRGQTDLFCAGNDLADFIDPSGAGTAPALGVMDALHAVRKPVIAAVGGAAIGLGTTMLFHCDVVYATPEARFGMPFVPLGVCPEFGTSRLAPAFSSHVSVAEAILFGELFGVEQARAMGFITQVVSTDTLIDYARKRARKLAGLPRDAVLQTKAMLKETLYAGMPALFRQELRQFNAMLQGDEARAAINLFLSKTKA